MRTPSIALHTFISAMSQKEKEIFEAYLMLRKDPHGFNRSVFLAMFHTIQKMKTYDEDALKKAMNGHLTSESFKTAKSQLVKMIVGNIIAYDTRSYTFNNWYKKMVQVQLLISEGLNDEALKILREMKKYPEEKIDTRYFLHLLEATETELGILDKAPGNYTFEKSELTAYLHGISEIIYRYNTLRNALARLDNFASHSLLLNVPDDKNQFQYLYNQFLSDPNVSECQYLYFRNKGHISAALIRADFDSYHGLSMSTWETFNQASIFKFYTDNMPGLYGDIFVHAVRSCILSRKPGALKRLLEKCETEYNRIFSENEYYLSFFHHAHLMLAYMDDDREQMAIRAVALEKSGNWRKENYCLYRLRTFSTSLAMVYHKLGQYKKALNWVHQVTNTNPNLLTDIHYYEFCRLFQFVIEYEKVQTESLNAVGSLIQSLESTHHALKKEDGLNHASKSHEFELVLTKCLLQAVIAGNSVERNEAFKTFEEGVASIKHKNTYQHFNALFDFKEWIRIRFAQHLNVARIMRA